MFYYKIDHVITTSYCIYQIKLDFMKLEKSIMNTVETGYKVVPLRWRHNERDDVSNHQPHDCLLSRLFRRRSNKTSKLRVTGLREGNSPVTGESPHKGSVTRKMFPFNDVIMHMILDDGKNWPAHSNNNPMTNIASAALNKFMHWMPVCLIWLTQTTLNKLVQHFHIIRKSQDCVNGKSRQKGTK